MLRDIPLRLLDCFGFGGPSLGAAVDCLRTGAFLVVVEACLRAPLATGGWSSLGLDGGGLGLARRKTDGEGMWISSAITASAFRSRSCCEIARGCQCMAGLRCTFGVKNEARRGCSTGKV